MLRRDRECRVRGLDPRRGACMGTAWKTAGSREDGGSGRMALLWLPAGVVATAMVRFLPETVSPEAAGMRLQMLRCRRGRWSSSRPAACRWRSDADRVWRLGYRRAAWAAGIALGAVTVWWRPWWRDCSGRSRSPSMRRCSACRYGLRGGAWRGGAERQTAAGRRRAGGAAARTGQCRAASGSPAPSRRHLAASAVHAARSNPSLALRRSANPHRFVPGQHDKGGGDREGHVLDENPDLVDRSASVSSTGAKQKLGFSGRVPAVIWFSLAGM